MSARSLSTLLFGAISAAMLGLAAGAVWTAAALYRQDPMPWLAVPVGAVLAWAIRGCIRPGGPATAVLAAAATFLAAIYVHMLVASLMIAGSMGLGLVDSIRTAGIGMLWQLSRMAASPTDITWAVLAALLAGWLGWRKPRRPPPLPR